MGSTGHLKWLGWALVWIAVHLRADSNKAKRGEVTIRSPPYIVSIRITQRPRIFDKRTIIRLLMLRKIDIDETVASW